MYHFCHWGRKEYKVLSWKQSWHLSSSVELTHKNTSFNRKLPACMRVFFALSLSLSLSLSLFLLTCAYDEHAIRSRGGASVIRPLCARSPLPPSLSLSLSLSLLAHSFRFARSRVLFLFPPRGLAYAYLSFFLLPPFRLRLFSLSLFLCPPSLRFSLSLPLSSCRLAPLFVFGAPYFVSLSRRAEPVRKFLLRAQATYRDDGNKFAVQARSHAWESFSFNLLIQNSWPREFRYYMKYLRLRFQYFYRWRSKIIYMKFIWDKKNLNINEVKILIFSFNFL